SAAALAVLPPVITGLVSGWENAAWSQWILSAINFLIISCPCALVISVPMSFFGGIGGASRVGILIKGSNYLEALAKAETVVFDKTGTLTKGSFKVTAIHPEKIDENALLDLAATAESYSDHPISRSLKQAYAKEVDNSRVGEVREIAGHGIKAMIDGKQVCVGNRKFMRSIGAQWHECDAVGTVVHVAVDGEYEGHIIVSDEIKPDAKEGIERLRRIGVKKTVMLTGDASATGKAIGEKLGVDEVHSELLPADKVGKLEELLDAKSAKGKVVYVGDGINDAPVLARGDIGIAMGALGSDAAIEAADVVLMDDKPSKVATAIAISRRTLRIVRQNIVFAISVKVIVLLLSMMPFVGTLPPIVAIFADVGVMILAVLNAMRALYVPKN
ncbi:MAG: cadmium-translocating P-type ATPase, partial [Clostridia bacterium]|nr:cadmium-translocating P-type ATPase [Clostridia bacterium]